MSYLAAAFNARPFGMPVPPNWFFLAAFGLLGAFVNPGFLFIGAGLEAMYLWFLARNPRFRNIVDARQREQRDGVRGERWSERYNELLDVLDNDARRLQESIEQEAAETASLLKRNGAIQTQTAGVRQLAWLHLKLLAARAAFSEVLSLPTREREALLEQQQRLEQRLAAGNLDEELARSLDRQLEVIITRRKAHVDAARRRELVDAEIARVRQRMSLLKEQTLLASDEAGVARSLDALAASLNEADRWFHEQRDVLGDLDPLADGAPPEHLMQASKKNTRPRRSVGENS